METDPGHHREHHRAGWRKSEAIPVSGAAVKAARVALGLTQDEARKRGAGLLSRGAMSSLENSGVTLMRPDRAHLLAESLGLTIEELRGGTPSANIHADKPGELRVLIEGEFVRVHSELGGIRQQLQVLVDSLSQSSIKPEFEAATAEDIEFY